jgi:hypothetical protein
LNLFNLCFVGFPVNSFLKGISHMKSLVRILSILAIVCVTFSTSFAQETQKGAKGGEKKAGQKQGKTSLTDQFIKQLEPAGLSEDQIASIKKLMTGVADDVAAKREKAGVTAQILRKRGEVRKAGTEAGKKGADLKKYVEDTLGLTDDQKSVIDETEKAMTKVKLEAGKLLSKEQLEKLPAQVRRSVEAAAPKGAGKNKQDK